MILEGVVASFFDHKQGSKCPSLSEFGFTQLGFKPYFGKISMTIFLYHQTLQFG